MSSRGECPRTVVRLATLLLAVLEWFPAALAQVAPAPKATPTATVAGQTAPTNSQSATPSSSRAVRIFRDWVYPTADLAIKLAAGIFVAYYLSRRGWKDKRKEKLIDAYIDYLDGVVNVFETQNYRCTEACWRLFRHTLEHNLPDKAYVNDLRSAIENVAPRKPDAEDSTKVESFGVYTYKFCFLLGKKYYFKHVMPKERAFFGFLTDNCYGELVAASILDEAAVKEALVQVLNEVKSRDRQGLDLRLKDFSERSAL